MSCFKWDELLCLELLYAVFWPVLNKVIIMIKIAIIIKTTTVILIIIYHRVPVSQKPPFITMTYLFYVTEYCTLAKECCSSNFAVNL